MTLTREQLLADLYEAYYDARKHKRNKGYQLRFEARLAENLEELCDALYTRTYRPLPSSCFIITDPKKREVFAAEFRDRVVHHLYYNYTYKMFERTFIHDTYSCLAGRGTHYGIRRLAQHIRSASRNYTRPCWVMKMDIRGYFMSINRERLLEICLESLARMSRKLRVLAASGRQKWQASLNSYCGVLSHWQNYRLRRQLMTADGDFTGYGMFNSAYTKYVMLSIQNGTARYQNRNCAVFDSKLRSFSSETAQFETRNRAV